MREKFGIFYPIISATKRLEKLLVREALSQMRNWGGGFLNIIWGQTAAGSAWVHCLLGYLKEKLVDTMDQNERLAWREINGRVAHGRWMRRMYPNRILCIKLILLFYTPPDWWCTVLSRQEGEQAAPLWSCKTPSSWQICVSLSKKGIHTYQIACHFFQCCWY